MTEEKTNSTVQSFEELAAKHSEQEAQVYLLATKNLACAEVQHSMLVGAFPFSGLSVAKHKRAEPIVALSQKVDELRKAQHAAFENIKQSVARTLEENPITAEAGESKNEHLLIHETATKIASDVLAANKEMLEKMREAAAQRFLDAVFPEMQQTIGVKGYHEHELVSLETALVDSTMRGKLSHVSGNGYPQHIDNAGKVVFSNRDGIRPNGNGHLGRGG